MAETEGQTALALAIATISMSINHLTTTLGNDYLKHSWEYLMQKHWAYHSPVYCSLLGRTGWEKIAIHFSYLRVHRILYLNYMFGRFGPLRMNYACHNSCLHGVLARQSEKLQIQHQYRLVLLCACEGQECAREIVSGFAYRLSGNPSGPSRATFLQSLPICLSSLHSCCSTTSEKRN